MPDQEVQQTKEAPGRAAVASAPAVSLADQYEVGEDSPTEAPGVAPQDKPSESVPTPLPASVGVNAAGRLYDKATGQLLPQTEPSLREPQGQEAPAAVPRHPVKLIQEALELGYSDEDIETMSTADLRRDVRLIQAQSRQRSQENVDWAARQESVQRAQQSTQERREARQADSEEFSIAGYNDWDEGTKQAYNPLISEFNALRRRIKQLEANQGNLNNYLQQQQAMTLTERYDRAFAKHEQHLGKGSFSDFAPGDPMIVRRDAIISLVNADKSKASLEVKVDKAVAALYGRRQAPEPQPRYSAEQWAESGAARPTQRAGARELNGVKAAEASVANRLRDMQSSPEESGAADNDDFL